MADTTATTTTEPKPAEAKPEPTPEQTQAQPNGGDAPPTSQLAPIDSDEPLPALSEAYRANMPPAMALWFDDALFERAKKIATYLSKAVGIVPPHLLGKTESCFFVVEKSLTWRLSPSAVAMCTYQTPGGKIGFEGKLCQAILENSGHLIGGVDYEHFGDWSNVVGKFSLKKGDSGKEYAHRDWTRTDAVKGGCGVYVIATVRGKKGNPPVRHRWPFRLEQAFPMNSTLWATDPETQICYAAVRRFGSVKVPGIFMGLPFDRDDDESGENAVDITPPPPQPTREQFKPAEPDQGAGQRPADEPPEEEGFALVDADGEIVWSGGDVRHFCNMFISRLTSVLSPKQIEGIWETNSAQLSRVPPDMAEEVRKAYGKALEKHGWKPQPRTGG